MRFPSRPATFMRDLQRNNDRDWFNDNKDRYTDAKDEVEAFAKTLFDALAETDELEPKRSHTMRIYRDTRFSKDKTPYKRFWGGGMDRLGKERRGGYYWHVEPGGLEYFPDVPTGGECFVGGGFWAPEKDDLKRIREELAVDHVAFRKLLASEPIKSVFGGELHRADMLKTAPRDYPKDHPAIDLLRHKSFVLVRTFTKQEVADENFSGEVLRTFVAMRPFLDYMSHVLVTDANGVSVL